MKKYIENIIADLLLVFSGAILFYDFFIILTQDRVYPIPNCLVFVLFHILFVGMIVLATRGIKKRESLRRDIATVFLSSGGCGLAFAYIISPWRFLTSGNHISSYHGFESITAVVVVEMSLSGLLLLFGLFNLFIDVKTPRH